jgi:hypothetical protein
MLDARRVCESLDVDALTLAEVFRREAARLLRAYAVVLESASPLDDDHAILGEATHWLLAAAELEREANREGDGGDPRSSEATSDAATAVAGNRSEAGR